MADQPAVWHAMLDTRYLCEVKRIGPYKGKITMTDTTNPADKPMLDMEIVLSFDAAFGPDVADVNAWMQLCVDTVERKAT